MEWLPDELRLSGVADLTVDEVADYERRRDFDPSVELALLRDLGLSADDRIVEFGSGPGAFALAAAGIAAEVIAVDPSPAMGAHLRQRARETGIANLAVVTAGFLTYRHEGRPAGYVFSKNALHQLPDFWKARALVRIHDLLRPGGVLRLRDLVYSFPPREADERLAAWIDAGDGGWSRAERVHHVRAEFSTYAWLLEEMLDRAGFDIAGREYSATGIFARYTCRRPS